MLNYDFYRGASIENIPGALNPKGYTFNFTTDIETIQELRQLGITPDRPAIASVDAGGAHAVIIEKIDDHHVWIIDSIGEYVPMSENIGSYYTITHKQFLDRWYKHRLVFQQ